MLAEIDALISSIYVIILMIQREATRYQYVFQKVEIPELQIARIRESSFYSFGHLRFLLSIPDLGTIRKSEE